MGSAASIPIYEDMEHDTETVSVSSNESLDEIQTLELSEDESL